MSELLSVPLKNTSEVDWTSHLKKLMTHDGNEKEFEECATELNRLRTLITSGKQLERSQTGVEIISRYYDQIKALETKLPLETPKLIFSWEDAFDKGTLFGGKVSTSLPFLVFERFCVLFNLGAFLSQLGAEHQLADSDEEMKTVAKWFQMSSGIFTHLSSSIGILSSEPLSADLNPDTLNSLSALMLAQAQEIFVTKAIKDKMKDSLIAKLCTQAEDMYSDTLQKLTKETVKYQWDRTWLGNVAGKQLAFAALAQFFQSQACAASKRVGEQIARLNVCFDTLTKAQIKIGNGTLYSYYIMEATRLANEARKDNDFIYHEQIPDPSTLLSIDKVPSARLAKATNISQQNQLSANFSDLFRNLKTKAIPMDCEDSDPPVRPARAKEYAKNDFTHEPEKEQVRGHTSSASESNSKDTTNESSDKNADTDAPADSPLKQALDASLYAATYYMKQYWNSGKSENK